MMGIIKNFIPSITKMLGKKETKEFVEADVSQKMASSCFVMVGNQKLKKVKIFKVPRKMIVQSDVLNKNNIEGNYDYDDILKELEKLLKNV